MRKLLIMTAAVAALCGFAKIDASELQIGFVNFKTCVEKSKLGQQEKNAFEALKKQMGDSLETTNKELTELAKKLEDQDYMDGLSPTAEEELKNRFQGLSQEFSRYQNQYYQVLNQANYKLLQSLHDRVGLAAEQIRKKHNLALILSEDSALAFTSSLDFTNEIIDEMNNKFDKENKEVADLK